VKDNRILCTFVSSSALTESIFNIRGLSSGGCVFILGTDKPEEYAVTYNAEIPELHRFPENTILVHRHKDTNTLYTINALNMLIVEKHGVLEKGWPVCWIDYKNSILLTREQVFVQIHTTLVKILRPEV
jgi:hypothetical protein